MLVARVALVAGGLLAAGVCAACVSPPTVEHDPSPLTDAGAPRYADIVLAYVSAGVVTSCTEVVPTDCDQAPVSSCPDHPALGAPDGTAYVLGPDDRLQVGFLCSAVLELGGDASQDFRIWASPAPGARATVSVSFDGSSYVSLDELTTENQGFDISEESLDVIRFVEVANTGTASIDIDAFEALF